ncbi:aBC-type amino acid transport/signal transduction system periplasmic component/domain protein [Ruminococcus sp. CAG:579]|jgi:putative lysine transport system permease protein|uniref:amino acid ABC transporter permease n=1 Tax=Ruminococcus sp. 210702-SL.1.03 TaxID=2883233 RepID=UPI0003381A93|nr:amino acid ABC transporter permease [Ruminococcus sp. 210702-SL.1.03]MCB6615188.1 amino acid ABC transporter permease [Ruminococcus sp. 210702-SL.1.03]CDA72870.1 aBC-type amino acid transport/signal transduction system periplasmic component/domain protein [Ruminococcus sp. CAG:579]
MNFKDPTNMIEWIVYIALEYKDMFLQGLWITLYISIVGTLVGFIVGYLVGIVQDIKINKDDNIIKRILMRLLKIICLVYVEIFRGTPMIVQGMIVYYGLLKAEVNITPVLAGIIVTVLNTGAYMAETVRGGINSVDKGQKEGAWSLGMSPMKTMLLVVLPQAFKNVVPEMVNTFLTNLKMTSVLNVIGVSELFLVAKTAGGTYYKYFEAYLVIAVIYFVLCFIFNRVFMALEKKLGNKSDYVLATEYIEEKM